MISNKTVLILALVILSIVPVISTSDVPKTSAWGKLKSLVKKPASKPETKKNTPKLKGSNDEVVDVQLEGISSVTSTSPQRNLVPSTGTRFGTLIDRRKYKKIIKRGKHMNNDEFLKQICPVVTTMDHYNGLSRCLHKRKIVASFYVRGNIKVVRGAIVNSKVCDKEPRVWGGDLEAAIALALKEDHDRVIDLFNIRQDITAEKDKQLKEKGGRTSFEKFVHWLLYYLKPWENGIAFKRFLTFRSGDLGTKYRGFLDVLCRELVNILKGLLPSSSAEKQLVELIGQPPFLTKMSFISGLLYHADDMDRYDLIRYGWREVIQESLKREHVQGGEKLWKVMTTRHPDQFYKGYPNTPDALAAVLDYFRTKEQLEERWVEENAPIVYKRIKKIKPVFRFLPTKSWRIVAEYAISWTDTDDSVVPRK